ncbi:MAG TPA: methyltransferase domain-containing protein [Bacteroidia bacterium]|nr:methyltransferase domain-containing protein [Bacteroidia bacterium]
MTSKVELFYDTYKNYAEVLYGEIRKETYGEDIGQTSWLTADEYRNFFSLMHLSPNQKVLEVASGSGGPAVFMVKETGCRLVGVDINENGVANATKLAAENGLTDKIEFAVADASSSLLFADGTFDAIVCIDSINHFKARENVFKEFRRVLKKTGRLLFTDAVVITGILTNEEIAIRSSLGFFLFVPKGENERLLKESGFREIVARDVTDNIIASSRKWHDAREKRKSSLLKFEDEEKFNGVQAFLQTTYLLSLERRLSRFMYTCLK